MSVLITLNRFGNMEHLQKLTLVDRQGINYVLLLCIENDVIHPRALAGVVEQLNDTPEHPDSSQGTVMLGR